MYNILFKKSQSYKILKNDLTSNKLNHVYLLISEDIDKISDFSKSIASMILCENKNDFPCFECVNCRKVSHFNHADVLCYPAGKALTVDEAKDISTSCYVVPIECDYKIFIINNIDASRTDAQNKLLKTLEEPPKNTIFILTATGEDMVLPTIRSRAKIIHESNETNEDLIAQFESITPYPKEMLNSLVEFSNGSVSIFNSFLTDKKTNEILELCFSILLNLNKSGMVLEYTSKIIDLKDNFMKFMGLFQLILRDVACEQIGGIIFIKSKKSQLEEISSAYSIDAISKIMEKCIEINEKMKFNCNINCVVDNFLLYILEVKYLWRKN